MADNDMEGPSPEMAPIRISTWRPMLSQTNLTHDMIYHGYAGKGTDEDPYRVEWLENDPIDPLGYPAWCK